MIVIGLTGGIGSGKTTASLIIKEQGIPVIDADRIAREIVRPGMPAYQEIIEGLGDSVLMEDRELNRKRIGEIVFSDPEKLSLLNHITHKEIFRIIQEQLHEMKDQGVPLVFLDAPLLFEAGFEELTNQVWVVDAPDSLRLERIKERDNLPAEEIQKRIRSQMPRDKRNQRGDVILDNSKGREELKAQILQALADYEF